MSRGRKLFLWSISFGIAVSHSSKIMNRDEILLRLVHQFPLFSSLTLDRFRLSYNDLFVRHLLAAPSDVGRLYLRYSTQSKNQFRIFLAFTQFWFGRHKLWPRVNLSHGKTNRVEITFNFFNEANDTRVIHCSNLNPFAIQDIYYEFRLLTSPILIKASRQLLLARCTCSDVVGVILSFLHLNLES
jgi:hypothetical protein